MTAPLNQLPDPSESCPDSVSSGSPREFGLAQLRDFLMRHRWLLIGLPLIAVLATFVVTRMIPRRYEAIATLLVSEPDFESIVEGTPLPIHGFQWILESPRVLRVAEQRIAAESRGMDIELVIGDNVDTEMLVRRREESALAPLIEVKTRADSPELAIVMAEAWSQAFIDHLSELREAELTGTLETITRALEEAEASLRESEVSRSEGRAEFEKERAKLASQWRSQSAKTLSRHDERLAQLRVETRERLSSALEPFDSYREDLSPAARGALDRVLALRLQLADVPERLVLISNVVPDSVFVGVGAREAEVNHSSISFAEEVNPAHLELIAQVLEAEKSLLQITGEDPTLRRLLAEVSAAQQRGGTTRASHEFARLGDLQLEEQRHRLAEEALLREFEVFDSRLSRQVDQELQFRDSVAARHGAALLSLRAQSGAFPIQTAAEAVVPRQPMSRNLPRRLVISALLGLMMAIGLGVARDVT